MSPEWSSSTTIALVRPQRARLATWIAESGVTDAPHDWIDTASAALMKELARRGVATTRELGEALPDYAIPITIARGTSHAELRPITVTGPESA